MKKLLFPISIVIGSLFLFSCDEKDSEEPPQYDEVTISLKLVGEPEEDRFTVTIAPSQNSVSYRYAIDDSGQQTAFENGTMDGIITLNKNSAETVSFTGLEPETEYTVYAQSFRADNVRSEVETLFVKTAKELIIELPLDPDVEIVLLNQTVAYAEFTAKVNETSTGFMAMVLPEGTYESYLEEWFDGEDHLGLFELISEEFMRVVYSSDSGTYKAKTSNLLNQQYVLHILVLDKNGDAFEVKHIDFDGPFTFQDGAPEARMTVAVDNITSSNANLIYTPGENALGYYGELLEGWDWDETGLMAHFDKFFGMEMMIFFIDEYVDNDWDGYLDPDTEYTVAGWPTNVNGAQGIGEITMQKFKTASASRSAGLYNLKVPGRNGYLRHKLRSAIR